MFIFRVKEGRENETQFCCVLMLCDAGWIMYGDWEKRNREIRPAFDGVVFPFCLPRVIVVVAKLDDVHTQSEFPEGIDDETQ